MIVAWNYRWWWSRWFVWQLFLGCALLWWCLKELFLSHCPRTIVTVRSKVVKVRDQDFHPKNAWTLLQHKVITKKRKDWKLVCKINCSGVSCPTTAVATFSLFLSWEVLLVGSKLFIHVTKISTFTLRHGGNQLFISGEASFMKFHSMTSSFLFNRGITFSQTVTYNNIVFLPQTRSPYYKHTYSAQRWLIETDETKRFTTALEAKSPVSSEISDFTPYAYAQSNIQHIK